MKTINGIKKFIIKYWMCIAFTIIFYFSIINNTRHIPYDFEYYHYPLFAHLYNSLYKGIFPLWNQFYYGGQSFIANPQVGFFYPLTYLPFIIGLFNNNVVTRYMCEYIMIVSFCLGMCGFYRLFLKMKFNKLLSFLGAILVMISGFSVSQYQHLGVLEIISLIPFAIYIWIDLIKDEGKNNWFKLAIIDSLIIFTGFLPYAISFFVVEVLILFIFSKDKKNIILKGIRHYFIIALLTCVLLLPTATNAGVSKDLSAHPGLDLHNLLSLFEPNFYHVKYGVSYGYNHTTYNNLWTGILFPIFLLAGLFNSLKDDDKKKWIYIILYILGVLIVYKPISGIIANIVGYIPGVGTLWRAEDFLIFVHIASVIYVLKGIQSFTHKRKDIILSSIILISITVGTYLFLITDPYHLRGAICISSVAFCTLLLMMQIYNKISIKTIEAFLLIAFTSQILLFQFNIHFYSEDGSSLLYESYINTELYDTLREDNSLYRVFAQQSTNGAEWTSAWPVWGLESVNGYDPTINYDFIEYMSDFSNYNGRMFDLADGDSDKLQFLNIKYVVTREDGSVIANNNNFELVNDGFYRTYKYKKFKERYIKIKNINLLSHPITTTDLEKGEELHSKKNGEVTTIKVDAKENDLLFISELYNKDWHAKINGKEVNIIKANKIFMAIPLTEGNNNIEIFYKPFSFIIGLIISAISWLVFIIAYIYNLKKDNKKKSVS